MMIKSNELKGRQMSKGDNINDIIDHKLFSEKDIHEMCVRLGKQLTEDYAGKKPLVVGALKGAIYFLTDLTSQMDVAHQLDFIDVSSYGDGFESTGKVKIVTDLATDVKDRDVLIVEDIVDTGQSLLFMKDLLAKRGARSIKVATLLDKKEGRKVEVTADYIGFDVRNQFVVGYGLDYKDFYRNLPYVGILKKEVYTK